MSKYKIHQQVFHLQAFTDEQVINTAIIKSQKMVDGKYYYSFMTPPCGGWYREQDLFKTYDEANQAQVRFFNNRIH